MSRVIPSVCAREKGEKERKKGDRHLFIGRIRRPSGVVALV